MSQLISSEGIGYSDSRCVDVSSHSTPAHEHLQTAEWPILPQNVSVRTARISYSTMPDVSLANQNEPTVRTPQLGLFTSTLFSFFSSLRTAQEFLITAVQGITGHLQCHVLPRLLHV